jgi:hypothetical protein
MRAIFALLAVAVVFWPLEAGAYENFIPLGHTYAPGQNAIPPLNTAKDQFNTQVDIYESEIYVRQRTEKIFESNINQSSSVQEFRGGGDFIDY